MNAAQKESSMIFGSKSKIVVLEILFRAVPIYFFLSENIRSILHLEGALYGILV